MANDVLIVDDEPLHCDMLKEVSQQVGCEVTVCHDGKEAIANLKVKHGDYGIMFLDIFMPEVDGVSALGHVRSSYPELPVVIISGTEDESYEQTAIELGAAGYLSKPFDAAEVKRLLANYMGSE